MRSGPCRPFLGVFRVSGWLLGENPPKRVRGQSPLSPRPAGLGGGVSVASRQAGPMPSCRQARIWWLFVGCQTSTGQSDTAMPLGSLRTGPCRPFLGVFRVSGWLLGENPPKRVRGQSPLSRAHIRAQLTNYERARLLPLLKQLYYLLGRWVKARVTVGESTCHGWVKARVVDNFIHRRAASKCP